MTNEELRAASRPSSPKIMLEGEDGNMVPLQGVLQIEPNMDGTGWHIRMDDERQPGNYATVEDAERGIEQIQLETLGPEDFARIMEVKRELERQAEERKREGG